MTERLQKLSDAGVSIWLDDLSRERLDSGNLEELIKEKSVVGVTTNPTIFAAALSNGEAYDTHIRELAATDTDVKSAVKSIMAADVRDACDRFTEIYTATDGFDGRVSIEVDATLAEQTQPTIDEAQELWASVDRPNCLIKVPATKAGLPAITATIAAGISVNVTLIFGLDRYRAVIEAYIAGLEQAAAAGHDLSQIHSVASFFVSRVDAEVDKRLDAIGGEATELKGKAAVANARLAHQLFRSVFTDGGDELAPRWKELEAQGARPQRPLWASTGVKSPDYPDTMYVDDLVTTGVVNTMPEKTLDAVADHGELRGDTVINTAADAQQVMDRLSEVGVDMDDVVEVLEVEGVEKFVKSGEELLETVRVALETAQRTPDSDGPVRP